MPRTHLAPSTSFGFADGSLLAKKYIVLSCLGRGWEGEVYLLREINTGIERAAKIFFPQRNQGNKALNFYARKLHKLRDCPALIQYHTQETFNIRGKEVSFLVSDYVDGQPLNDFLKTQPNGRLDSFQGLHLLHCLLLGIERIHKAGEYHGDLHPGNILIRRQGLSFDVRLLDFFHWGRSTQDHLREDLFDVIRILYDAIGGPSRYYRQPQEIKAICMGLKRTLILKRFKNTTALREHIEALPWGETYN